MKYQLEKEEMDEIRDILHVVGCLGDKEEVPEIIRKYEVSWNTLENLARRANELKWKLQ